MIDEDLPLAWGSDIDNADVRAMVETASEGCRADESLWIRLVREDGRLVAMETCEQPSYAR